MTVQELIQSAEEGGAFDKDAMLHVGEATWDRWQCHVPMIVVALWDTLPVLTKAAVFMTARSISMMNDPRPNP